MDTIDRRTFGGNIYDFDYDMNYCSIGFMAERISGDIRFDERCKRAVEQRDKLKSGFYYKNKGDAQ